MQRILSPSQGTTEDLLDYDGVLGMGNMGKKIAIGHKRTKTLYKLNKNLKVFFLLKIGFLEFLEKKKKKNFF